jgi:hypothetical protein
MGPVEAGDSTKQPAKLQKVMTAGAKMIAGGKVVANLATTAARVRTAAKVKAAVTARANSGCYEGVGNFISPAPSN